MAKHQPFAVFDIDGTLIRWQMLHAVFDMLGQAGHLLEGDYEKMLDARRSWQERKLEEGYANYEHEVVQVVERNLTKIEPKNFEQACEEVFAEHKDRVYRYTRDLIRELKQKGYFILAVTGVPSEMMTFFAEYYGFDDYAATVHEQQDGRYTGNIMVAPRHKTELLNELIAKHGLSFEGSIGVGDSEGDISMLELVEYPIAFNPTKKLFLHAEQSHWKVVVERKNMIYEFEPKDDHYRLSRANSENQE